MGRNQRSAVFSAACFQQLENATFGFCIDFGRRLICEKKRRIGCEGYSQSGPRELTTRERRRHGASPISEPEKGKELYGTRRIKLTAQVHLQLYFLSNRQMAEEIT